MNTEIRVLFPSPYSGCRCFSGWNEVAPDLPKAPTNVYPAQRNAPGAILCADRYRKISAQRNTPTRPIPLAPSPVPRAGPTQAGRFLVAGPSSTGPFSVADISGGTFDTGPKWTLSGRSSVHSLGLT